MERPRTEAAAAEPARVEPARAEPVTETARAEPVTETARAEPVTETARAEPATRLHQFAAVAFEENLSLRELAPAFPGARLTLRELQAPLESGQLFIYPFGAIVFLDAPPEQRDQALARLNRARPGLTTQVVRETFTVRERAGASVEMKEGALVVDRLTPDRAAVVALIVGQSAAMEYYERIVGDLFRRTSKLVEPLEKTGTVPLQTRRLHRFIGEAIATRSEVILVVSLLDKPDATWDDPAMDRIYDDLRAEFDLADRYTSLEQKLSGVQEALELVLDVARDRRMMLLEVFIAALIVLEVVLELLRRA
jgi:uncharacterized Rmd1/YagE family protein